MLIKPAVISLPVFLSLLLSSQLKANVFDFLWSDSQLVEQNSDFSSFITTSFSVNKLANSRSKQLTDEARYLEFQYFPDISNSFHLGAYGAFSNQTLDLTRPETEATHWNSENVTDKWGVILKSHHLTFSIGDDNGERTGFIDYSDEMMGFYFRQKYFRDHQRVFSELSSENPNGLLLNIEYSVNEQLYQYGLKLNIFNSQLDISTHVAADDTFSWDQVRWDGSELSIPITLGVEKLAYQIPPQAILINQNIKGVSGGKNEINSLWMKMGLSEYDLKIGILDASIDNSGFFDASALSSHYLNPLLGTGNYLAQVELSSYTLKFEEKLSHNRWSYSYGLGYLKTDGFATNTINANPLGVFLNEKENLDLKSMLWGIGGFSYFYRHKNWSLTYQWSQVIPVSVNKTKREDEQDEEGDISANFKWPIPGSRQTLKFDYWFN